MIAKGSGYVRGAGARNRLIAHLKYIEHRAMSERETRDSRRIFSGDEDQVRRRDAVQDIMAHEHRGVAYHKIILSPGQDEPITDWREWTRAIMVDLQERQGRQLHWYAVQHDNTDNPHTHVVLAGLGENLKTGAPEQVRLYPADYQFLRERGSEHSEREQRRELKEWVREANERDSQEFKAYSGKEYASQEMAVGRDHNNRGDFGR